MICIAPNQAHDGNPPGRQDRPGPFDDVQLTRISRPDSTLIFRIPRLQLV
jgi:hypothetical protein